MNVFWDEGCINYLFHHKTKFMPMRQLFFLLLSCFSYNYLSGSSTPLSLHLISTLTGANSNAGAWFVSVPPNYPSLPSLLALSFFAFRPFIPLAALLISPHI